MLPSPRTSSAQRRSRETTSIVQEARTARVLEQAATTYEQQGAEAAQQMRLRD
jgi:hypothetical protein